MISYMTCIRCIFERSKSLGIMNTAIEQYIRELSDLLCCDKATKQQFLSKFQQTLEDFEAEQEKFTDFLLGFSFRI